MTTTQTPLGQFIIKRDGYLDTEYIDQLIDLERSQALQEAARTVLDVTKQQSLIVAKNLGTGLLRGLNDFLESVQ